MKDGASRLVYRPELDGIRGIAILLVILSHAEPSVVGPGAGTAGVTLFFVLSGYLITGLLLAERDRTGRINLRDFYERRVRRLGPALLALVVFTGFLMLALGWFEEFPGQAMATLFYSANFAEANGAGLGFLRHAWSLSLEEQFYLVWPALLIVIRRPTLLAWLAVGTMATIVAIRHAAPEATFPLLRGDAILAGCVLAIWPISPPRRLVPIALLAIGLVSLDYGGQHGQMGQIGLTVVTIASIVIVGAAPAWLGARWLVRIGQISYGLYLWHYAPSVLAGSLDNRAVAVAFVFTCTFALALASERWVERPWRRRRYVDREPAPSTSRPLTEAEAAGRQIGQPRAPARPG